MFSRWRVGRLSCHRQMSHSQQSLFKAASLSGGKLRPTISFLGLALKVHLCISMTAGPVYCPNTNRRDPKGKYDGHVSKYGRYVMEASRGRALLLAKPSVRLGKPELLSSASYPVFKPQKPPPGSSQWASPLHFPKYNAFALFWNLLLGPDSLRSYLILDGSRSLCGPFSPT